MSKKICRYLNTKLVKTLVNNLTLLKKPANFLNLVCRHFNSKFVKTGEVRLDSNLLINSGGILNSKFVKTLVKIAKETSEFFEINL